MNFPWSEDGVFEGGLLFDGCGYRQPREIVAFNHAPNRLGIVKDKKGYFVAEFLSKHASLRLSLPVWDAVRDPVICGSIAEAQALTEAFTNETIS
jgi:hypothetical protein